MHSRKHYAAALCLVLCVLFMVLLYAEQPLLAGLAKVCASLAFIATAIFAGATRENWSRLILAGLVLSLVGDAALTGNSATAFLAGLFAFLLAHLAYLAAFGVHGVNLRWVLGAVVPLAVVSWFILQWLEPATPADLLLPVRAYILAIACMVAMAAGTRGAGGSVLILAGALMFMVSDLSVAAQRLLQVEAATWVWGLPLYYGGQVCLALSCSQSRSH